MELVGYLRSGTNIKDFEAIFDERGRDTVHRTSGEYMDWGFGLLHSKTATDVGGGSKLKHVERREPNMNE